MAKNYLIDLDGRIGSFGSDKLYVKRVLESHPNETIEARINSLGGSLDDGLDIADQFREHGNVTVSIFGFTASAATIVAMGAKTIKMSNNAFVLFHRCSNWVDVWGRMNEEEIQRTIDELTKNKEDNKKIDLVLARMYAERCKKSIEDMHAIMRKSAWLTAQEAKELGFVDEIIEDNEKVEFTNSMATKFNVMDMPMPPCQITEDDKTGLEKIVDTLVNAYKKAFSDNSINNNKNQIQMRKIANFLALNAILAIDGIDFNDEAKTASLNEEQLKAINDKVNELQSEFDTQSEELTKKQTEIDDLQKQIANKDAEITVLKKTPGDDDQRNHDDGNDEPTNVVESARKMFNSVKELL